jgi:hypothetical protein
VEIGLRPRTAKPTPAPADALAAIESDSGVANPRN